jgi:hypothetical protein
MVDKRDPEVGETVVSCDGLLRGRLFSIVWDVPPRAKVLLVDGTMRDRPLDELTRLEPS